MKKNYFKKSLSLLLTVLMLLSCCAITLNASAAEAHECVWVLDDAASTRPSKGAAGWGNGIAVYTCTQPDHPADVTKTQIENRAIYTAYETLIADLNALLATDGVSDQAIADITAVLAEQNLADNLFASEQGIVDAAVAAIEAAVGKYVQKFTVTFVDQGTVISEQEVIYDFNAIEPAVSFKEGFVFLGWDQAFNNVTENLTVTAQYFNGRGYITTDTKQIGLKKGKSAQIAATLHTDEVGAAPLAWSIADTSIATVDANGKVKAVGVGYTTLTVSALDGDVSTTIDVYVYDGNEEYTVTLVNSGMGKFVINGNTLGTTFVNVKSGQNFRFQFALSSMYDPSMVVVTANGRTLTLTENNYFEIPFICEDTTIVVSLGVNGDLGGSDNTTPDGSACSCMCHSTNGLVSFFWKLLTFFSKLLGLDSNRICECGVAHW